MYWDPNLGYINPVSKYTSSKSRIYTLFANISGSKLQMYQPWGQQGRCILLLLPTYPTYELDASYFTPRLKCIISARTACSSLCAARYTPKCSPIPKFCAIPKRGIISGQSLYCIFLYAMQCHVAEL